MHPLCDGQVNLWDATGDGSDAPPELTGCAVDVNLWCGS